MLVDIAQNQGQYLFSGSGAGTIWDLFKNRYVECSWYCPDAVTWVPTTGAAPSIVELLGGHVDAITCSIPEAYPQIASGDLKALAIMADGKRFKI